MGHPIDNKLLASHLRKPTGMMGKEISQIMSGGNVAITESTVKQLALKPGEAVIEIGPGNGLLSLPVLNAIGKTGSYTAIDHSDDMAKLVLQNLQAGACKNIKVIHANCQTDDIHPPVADALFAVNVLYFIENLEILFSKVHAWLKDGGRVAFGVHTKESMAARPFTQFGFKLREKDDYLTSLRSAGFKDVNFMEFNMGAKEFNGVTLPSIWWVVTGRKGIG